MKILSNVWRVQDEEQMYHEARTRDYSKVTDWSVLFSNANSYYHALVNMKNPFHKEAMQIRENRKRERDWRHPEQIKEVSPFFEKGRELLQDMHIHRNPLDPFNDAKAF
jgi:hypothetical protein